MDPKKGIVTLDEFIIKRQQEFKYTTGDLSRLLRDIGFAAKIINREINKAGLVDILGEFGTENIHGESVKKLDIFADTILIDSLRACGGCAAIASEEHDEILTFNEEIANDASYLIAFDPLDGSSNIDVNVSVGTIFSIYRRHNGHKVTEKDFMQKGLELAASGYVIYGSSTMLVYTTGYGVNGFTLDPSIGEFCLSHPDIKIPSSGNVYSLNQGNSSSFPEGVKKYINYCQAVDKEDDRPYSLRYIGSMVADFHRNLLKGGIFIYPSSDANPEGKLRLLYECNPLSFIVEQAGGRSTNGLGKRIMDIEPKELHQKTPIFIGSIDMVDTAEEFMKKYSSAYVEN
jgi:fructose-1,6-bisphosphatase I